MLAGQFKRFVGRELARRLTVSPARGGGCGFWRPVRPFRTYYTSPLSLTNRRKPPSAIRELVVEGTSYSGVV